MNYKYIILCFLSIVFAMKRHDLEGSDISPFLTVYTSSFLDSSATDVVEGTEGMKAYLQDTEWEVIENYLNGTDLKSLEEFDTERDSSSSYVAPSELTLVKVNQPEEGYTALSPQWHSQYADWSHLAEGSAALSPQWHSPYAGWSHLAEGSTALSPQWYSPYTDLGYSEEDYAALSRKTPQKKSISTFQNVSSLFRQLYPFGLNKCSHGKFCVFL